ncbi:MAG TPA: hypothetical protein VGH15_09620 [Caulobacteraceae bacterium]|jgi:hypothetical protein
MAVFNPAGGAPVSRSAPAHGLKGVAKIMQSTVTLSSAAALNDTINFGYVPAGATVRDVSLAVPAGLDSGVSKALTLDVGDATTANAYIAASTIGQAGGKVGAFAGLGTQYSADTLITGKIHAAATTMVAGGVVCTVTYTVDGLAS